MTIRDRGGSDGDSHIAASCVDCFQSVPIPATGSLTIADVEIHVWRVALDVRTQVERHLRLLLSPDEQARLERFRSPHDKRRFAVRRGMLRIVLSAYSGIPISELSFAEGENGKPMIDDMSERAAPCFNSSSSDDLALIAVSGQLPLGIDIEFMRQIDDMHDIVARYFSPQERESLINLPRDLHLRGFYRIWTSKEAIVKADGAGLSMPLDSFVVNCDPRRPAQLLSATQNTRAPKGLVLYGLDPGKAYSGALATSLPGLTLHYWSADLDQMT